MFETWKSALVAFDAEIRGTVQVSYIDEILNIWPHVPITSLAAYILSLQRKSYNYNYKNHPTLHFLFKW